ncbi:MAG: type II secretion system protein [Phycisphaerae bacterium]|nr:type II secretion system protein [Phycisphaerae bacterium]
MRNFARKPGFTLVEMLIVIAILVILVVLTIGVAKRVEDQGKERLTKATLGIIDAALEQFEDFNYQYKFNAKGVTYPYPNPDPDVEHSFAMKFPLDCNEFEFEPAIRVAIEAAFDGDVVNPSGLVADPNFSGITVMYFVLSQVPECRETLGKIDKKLKARKGEITIYYGVPPVTNSFLAIVDPWGMPLRYDYYDESSLDLSRADAFRYGPKKVRIFPLVTSAGPDKKFGTDDDITNQ